MELNKLSNGSITTVFRLTNQHSVGQKTHKTELVNTCRINEKLPEQSPTCTTAKVQTLGKATVKWNQEFFYRKAESWYERNVLQPGK